VIGVVLAGGRGRRIGGDKALAELRGRPLISYPIAALRAAGLDPVVVAKTYSSLPDLGCTVVREPTAPSHPLCGVVTALRWGEGRAVLVLGCDMPFVTGPLLAWLADLDGLVVTEADGRLQPLLARYEFAHLDALETAMNSSRSVGAAVAALQPRIVGDSELGRFGATERLLHNVNTAGDLEAAERLLVEGG
jgi:molybdopterin-guanine dinucleotide biosynthesis protein A